MTADQIQSMPAGPEMDMLVIMKVFGWRWARANNPGGRCSFLPPVPEDWGAKNVWQPSPWGDCFWMPLDGIPAPEERYQDWFRSCSKTTPGGRWVSGMPNPSTDWEAFGWVVDELARREWTVEMDNAQGRWNVMVIPSGNTMDARFAEGETMQLALCRAVLSMREFR